MIDVHFPEFGEQTVTAGKATFWIFLKPTKTKIPWPDQNNIIFLDSYDTYLKSQWDLLSMI